MDKEQEKARLLEKIKAEIDRVRNYTPRVGIFGDTGVGKSSLCNALFGSEVAEINHTVSCTRDVQEIPIGGEGNRGIILIDVPGLGENEEQDKETLELYKTLLPVPDDKTLLTDNKNGLDLCLLAVKADSRNYKASIDAFKDIIIPSKCPVCFVITQAEKIPDEEWNKEKHKPSENQQANLNEKIIDVSKVFKIDAGKIIAVSAIEGYQLTELASTIVRILPNSKKYSVAREVKREIVSEETREDAEKGVWYHIKEFAGGAWDSIKTEVLALVIESVIVYVPKVAKKILEWFKKRF